MRLSLRPCMFLLVTSMTFVVLPSRARADAESTFRAWARTQPGGIERWGVAQLDGDAALERFAFVCNEDEGALLIEKDAARRWSIPWTVDGRNECHATKTPKWQAEAGRFVELELDAHREHDRNDIALRGDRPVIVRTAVEASDPHHLESVRYDFDELVKTYSDCMQRSGPLDCHLGHTREAAIFILDGDTGTYRSRSVGAPSMEAVATSLDKRALVRVTIGRAAQSGDAVEYWTEDAEGAPMMWLATWTGTTWKMSRGVAAPRELPEVVGDATHVSVPILRRQEQDAYIEGATGLCVAWRSADRTQYVATCDLDTKRVTSFGIVRSPRYIELEGAQRR